MFIAVDSSRNTADGYLMKRSWLLLSAILCVSLALQIAAANQKSLWGDEVFTINYAQMEPAQLRNALPPHQQPLYYDLVSWWGNMLGYEKLPMRLLSILFVAITLVFTYLLSRDVFGEKIALISTAILGISPLLLLHGHNVRYYSLICALAILMAFSSYRFWKTDQPLYLLLYAGAGTLMLYILFTSTSFIVGIVIWWLVYFLLTKNRRIDSLLFWIAAQGVIIILWLPTYSKLAGFAQDYLQSSATQNLLFDFGKRLFYSGYVFSLGGNLSPLNPVSWIGIEAVFFILLFSLRSLRKSLDGWMPVFFTIWNMLAAVLLTFLSQEHSQTWQNLAHWFLYILPFLAMWLGAGLASFNKRIFLLFGIVLLLVNAVGVSNYFRNRQFFQGVYAIPWEGIFDQIRDQAEPETVVLCTSLEASCSYYGNQYGLRISTPEHIDRASFGSLNDLWWIYTHVGNLEYENTDFYQSFLDRASYHFEETQVFQYIQQDASIRWLKTRLFGHQDYEYQVDVYHFHSP